MILGELARAYPGRNSRINTSYLQAKQADKGLFISALSRENKVKSDACSARRPSSFLAIKKE